MTVKCFKFAICALTTWATALLLTGCVHFQERPLSSSQIAVDFETRTLANPELRAFLERNGKSNARPWPRTSWDFSELVLIGLFYHPDLDLARARWAVAKAGEKTAGERPNPTLTIAPAYNVSTGIPSPWLVGATLDIPIETAGKRGYRIKEAAQLSEVARLNIAGAAWAVRSRVRQSWVDLYASRELVTLLQEQQAFQIENLRFLEMQHQAGAISAFDVTQARIAADGTRLALRDAERQGAESRVQLADAMGVPVTALESASFAFDGIDDLPVEIPDATARRQALLGRTDVLSALAEYAASQSALQIEIAKQYPDIHLGPGYEFDQGDSKWSLGPSLTLPILSRNRGAIAEAEAKRTSAAATVIAIQAHAVGEIERALAGFRVALQKISDAAALRGNLKKQEKTAQAMLDAGEISRADVAALRLQLSAASLAGLDALAKAQQAFGMFEDAMQSPFGVSASVWETMSPRTDQTHSRQ